MRSGFFRFPFPRGCARNPEQHWLAHCTFDKGPALVGRDTGLPGVEEWLRSTAPASRCPGAILPLLAAYPLSPLGSAKSTRPLGFPGTWRRPLRFPSFLPPTQIEKAEGEGRTSTKRGRRARSSASRSLHPAPPAAPHPCLGPRVRSAAHPARAARRKGCAARDV